MSLNLTDPVENFPKLIKNQLSKDDTQKRLHLAKFSRKIIQELDQQQRTSLEISLKTESDKWKNCFKWNSKEAHQIGPAFDSDNFALPTLFLCQVDFGSTAGVSVVQ